MVQPLAFAALLAGAILLIAGTKNSSLASVVKGRPDTGRYPQPAGSSTAGATGGTPVTVTQQPGESVRQLAMRFFQSKGLSRAQAAGIVGNLQQESGLDPSAPGGFLAQWGGSRLAGLERFATRQGSQVTNPALQLEWIWQELQTSERGTLLQLQRATSPRQAARIFSNLFERPGIPAIGNREAYAEAAFKAGP